MKISIIALLIGLMATPSLAQSTAPYWIFFTDKNLKDYHYQEHLSEKAIQNRKMLGIPLYQQSDAPLTPHYVAALTDRGHAVVAQSKWLNAVVSYLSPNALQELENLSFVAGTLPCGSFSQPSALPIDKKKLGEAIAEMNTSHLFKLDLNGKNIDIGVIDAGYYGIHTNAYTEKLLEEKRVLGYRDYINKKNIFLPKKMETILDGHGTKVLTLIGGESKQRKQFGLATKANFYLARTDHGLKEFREEEAYWVSALEWLDSLGVRLVNTSLGYSNGFDDLSENYLPSQMNGKTSVVSRAANIAAQKKGMLMVVSAGNEGNEVSWQVVSTPADAEAVFSIGATNKKGLKAGYSSIGPKELPWLKPNISCYSASGTSFSAPVITGLVACMLQGKPYASAKEIFRAIEQSATLYPFGNNYLGYGIPNAAKAVELLQGNAQQKEQQSKVETNPGATSISLRLNNKAKNSEAVLFHKMDRWYVLSQELLTFTRQSLTIQKREGAKRTTVYFQGEVFEVVWK